MGAAKRRKEAKVQSDTDNNDDPELYWVAIRGAAVPSWPYSVREEVMRRAVVIVGRSLGETTSWLLPGTRATVTSEMQSNYDYLIGYHSLADQKDGITKLLHGTLAEARAEVTRGTRRGTIIFGQCFQ
jgi:hypothetical protein